jgi:hypothetical protein
MTRVHISLLTTIFIISFFYQPNWVYENFWGKANFYDPLPFTVPYLVFLFVYAFIATALAESGIRFVKKYV